jgi:Tfp pilus assembly protein PilO
LRLIKYPPHTMDNTNNTPGSTVDMSNMAPDNGLGTSLLTQKNIVMGAVLIVVLVILVGIFFLFSGEKAIDLSLLEQEEMELTSIDSGLNALVQDNAILDELNQTFGDILDENTEFSTVDALEESSIVQEASEADLSETLNAFAADDAVLEELYQVFGEVSQ